MTSVGSSFPAAGASTRDLLDERAGRVRAHPVAGCAQGDRGGDLLRSRHLPRCGRHAVASRSRRARAAPTSARAPRPRGCPATAARSATPCGRRCRRSRSRRLFGFVAALNVHERIDGMRAVRQEDVRVRRDEPEHERPRRRAVTTPAEGEPERREAPAHRQSSPRYRPPSTGMCVPLMYEARRRAEERDEVAELARLAEAPGGDLRDLVGRRPVGP